VRLLGAPVRLALFDLDGTLADTEERHFASVNRVLDSFGVRLPEEERTSYVGTGERSFWRRVVERFRLPVDVDECIRRRCERGVPLFLRGIRPFDGVPEGLAWLAASGVRLAVVSSTPLPLVETILRACGIRDRFEAVFSGVDPSVVREKPHPEPYLHALDRLGAAASETVVFEDSEPGVAAAKAAGCRCFVVRDAAARAGQNLSRADRVFANPRECFAFLRASRSTTPSA